MKLTALTLVLAQLLSLAAPLSYANGDKPKEPCAALISPVPGPGNPPPAVNPPTVVAPPPAANAPIKLKSFTEREDGVKLEENVITVLRDISNPAFLSRWPTLRPGTSQPLPSGQSIIILPSDGNRRSFSYNNLVYLLPADGPTPPPPPPGPGQGRKWGIRAAIGLVAAAGISYGIYWTTRTVVEPYLERQHVSEVLSHETASPELQALVAAHTDPLTRDLAVHRWLEEQDSITSRDMDLILQTDGNAEVESCRIPMLARMLEHAAINEDAAVRNHLWRQSMAFLESDGQWAHTDTEEQARLLAGYFERIFGENTAPATMLTAFEAYPDAAVVTLWRWVNRHDRITAADALALAQGMPRGSTIASAAVTAALRERMPLSDTLRIMVVDEELRRETPLHADLLVLLTIAERVDLPATEGERVALRSAIMEAASASRSWDCYEFGAAQRVGYNDLIFRLIPRLAD